MTGIMHSAIMRSAAALLAVMFLSLPAGAQDLQISGYYEHTLTTDYSKDTNELIMDASKLRLDFSSGIPGGLSFNGNMNYIVYHGEVSRYHPSPGTSLPR